jgi:uncharacterized protein (DUF2147 family)
MRPSPRYRCILVLALVASAAMADGDGILGVWATEPDGNQAHIEISKVDGLYEGRVVWLEEPVYAEAEGPEWAGKAKVDRENPDPELRSRPAIGLRLMEGFRYSGGNLWHKGTIYDPENGKTYKCKMTLSDDGVLKVRGFIGMSLLGRTTEWTRPEE